MLRGKAARTYPMMDASQRVNTTSHAPGQEYRVCRLFLIARHGTAGAA